MMDLGRWNWLPLLGAPLLGMRLMFVDSAPQIVGAPGFAGPGTAARRSFVGLGNAPKG